MHWAAGSGSPTSLEDPMSSCAITHWENRNHREKWAGARCGNVGVGQDVQVAHCRCGGSSRNSPEQQNCIKRGCWHCNLASLSLDHFRWFLCLLVPKTDAQPRGRDSGPHPTFVLMSPWEPSAEEALPPLSRGSWECGQFSLAPRVQVLGQLFRKGEKQRPE